MILVDNVFGYLNGVMPELEGKIIPANLDQTSPVLPYCTFKVSNEQTYGTPEVTYEDLANFEETSTAQKKAKVEVNFYAEPISSSNDYDARYYANLLVARFTMSKGMNASGEFMLFLAGYKDYSPLDEYLEDKLESRSIVEVDFFFTNSHTEEAEKVESFVHTGTIINNLGVPI